MTTSCPSVLPQQKLVVNVLLPENPLRFFGDQRGDLMR